MLRDWLKRQRQKPLSATLVQPSAAAATPGAPALDALRDIYLNLFDVQRSHALIDVAIDGTDARYQSIIIGIDPERGILEIDELFPAGFIGLPGQPVTITVRLDGKRRLTFNTHVISRHDDGQLESYWLALPASLDYNQRRGSFRLPLGQGWGVISEFLTSDYARCSARVRDLSATGIRLEVKGATRPNAGDILRDLNFEFGGRTYQCAADVRNVITNVITSGTTTAVTDSITDTLSTGEAADHFLIGAQFRDLPRLEQRALERMIMQLQRQQVQKATA